MIVIKGEERLSSENVMALIGKIQGIIYARVSTTDQANKGHSIESQIERCKQRALQKFNYTDNQLITLIEPGGMGDDPNRPALNYALHLLEKGLGKKIIILHPDRLTRDNTLQGVISRKIWSMGVDIEFVEFEVDPTNPESMLMYNIQGSIAQYNKAKIHANSKRGRITKARKGEFPSFKRLYGYTFNKETDLPEINEEEREILLEMKSMLLEKGLSCTQIAKTLSKKGIKSPDKEIWYQTTVSRILKNEDYTGNFYYGKSKVVQKNGKKKQVPTKREDWILIKIPAIWTSEDREEILKKIKSNSKDKNGRKTRDYLLKGKAVCGRCGGAAGSGTTSTTKSGVYKYYACRNKNVRGYKDGVKYTDCKGKNWRVDIVDDVFWKWFKKILSNPQMHFKKAFKNLSNDEVLQTLEKKKSKLNSQILELKKEESNYILLFGKGKISEEQFDTFCEPIEKKLEHFNFELNSIERQLNNSKNNIDESKKQLDYLQKFSELIEKKLSTEDKRRIIDVFIDRVCLNEDDTLNVHWKGFGESDVTFDSDKSSFNNRQGNTDNVQTYGGQTARIHSHSCWLLQGNGSFSIFKPRAAIQISNQYQLS